MTETKSKTRFAKLSILLTGAGLLLAGCHVSEGQSNPIEAFNSHTFDHANWRQRPPFMDSQVEEITVVHQVSFQPGESQLPAGELDQLLEFLQQSGVHQGARIEIDGPRDKTGYHDTLTVERLSAIETEITRLGLRSEVPVRPITTLAKPEEAVAVTVTRAMVIQPDCSTPQPGFATRPAAVFSCTTSATLGQMIADPVDLVRGRATGPAEAAATGGSIRRYRAGKTKALPIERTQ